MMVQKEWIMDQKDYNFGRYPLDLINSECLTSDELDRLWIVSSITYTEITWGGDLLQASMNRRKDYSNNNNNKKYRILWLNENDLMREKIFFKLD